MIDNTRAVFKTLTKTLEVIYVMHGIKPVTRIAVTSNNLNNIIDFCKKNNLGMKTSSFKVLMEVDGFYSNRGLKVDIKDKRAGHIFVYISKIEKLAEEALSLEESESYYRFGRILGYPSCCCRFFVENRPDETKRNNDYVEPAIKNSNAFNIHTNVFGRYFDATLLNHCPCSFECRKTIDIAKAHLKIVKDYSKETAQKLEYIMNSTVIYKEGAAYLLLKPIIKGNKIAYSKVLSTNNNFTYGVLKNAGRIEINKNGFVVGGRLFESNVLSFQ